MVQEATQRVQRGRYFAIVDEVDNILIDEARTPLIISGQAAESEDLYYQFARLVPRLKERPEGEEEGGDYFVDLKEHAVSPDGGGRRRTWSAAQRAEPLRADPRMARHFEQALRAHALYRRDRDYLVKDGEIVIVDEFTGRQMPGRRWSEGLHQAIEAKEGLRVQRESVTLATITFQNYFRLYDKLAGMTGTALTEAEEFYRIYGLDVLAMPTHRPMIRDDSPDLVYRSETAKFKALIDEIEELQESGRPVLVGTISVEKCEILSEMLKRRGIRHEVLNAKFHEKEAEIVAQAGRSERRHDRHQHGRPRHRHHPGRQPGRHRLRASPPAGPEPGRGGAGGLRGGPRGGPGRLRRGSRAGRGRGRPPHHRHRAPRRPPHRQPAARPGGSPGRPRVLALLPLPRRRR